MGKILYLNLQRFAEAGTLTNTTTGHVNAYTGQAVANTKMSPTMKIYYDTELMENARDKFVYQQLGRTYNLPANSGMTAEWRKFDTLPDAQVLQEAVIPEGVELGMTKTTASITQYGLYFTVSDVLDLHAIDDVILGGTQELGAAMGLTYEKLIRAELTTNANVAFADVLDSDGAYVSTPATRAQLITAMATAGNQAYMTVDMVEQTVTDMINEKVPFYSGEEYVCLIHPDCVYDIWRDKEWQAVKEYSPEDWLRGEIGRIAGVRFVRSPLAPVYSSANGNVYQCLFFGKDAFGVVDPEGAGMETIIKSREQVGGPLNQFSTVGSKFSMATKILYPERLKIVECASRRGKRTSANMGAAA